MATKTYITAIRLETGKASHVQHIARVWYGNNPAGSLLDKDVSTSEMVRYIDDGTYNAYVQDSQTYQEALVKVVRPAGRSPYLRTKADDDPNDNLLQLPRS
jgi:hypothetical protein